MRIKANGMCKAEGCGSCAKTKGYCQMHYHRIWRNGTLEVSRERDNNPPERCTLDGCDELHHAKGCCKRHYRPKFHVEKGKEYHRKNRKKRNVQAKTNYIKNRKERLEYAKNRREKYPEIGIAYREKNVVSLREKSCEYYKKHSESTTKHVEKLITRALYIYGRKCMHCGCTDIVVLQWHHRDGGNVGGNNGKQMLVVREVVDAGEICENILLLCSNCHIHQDIEDGTNKRGSRMQRIADRLDNSVSKEKVA